MPSAQPPLQVTDSPGRALSRPGILPASGFESHTLHGWFRALIQFGPVGPGVTALGGDWSRRQQRPGGRRVEVTGHVRPLAGTASG